MIRHPSIYVQNLRKLVRVGMVLQKGMKQGRNVHGILPTSDAFSDLTTSSMPLLRFSFKVGIGPAHIRYPIVECVVAVGIGVRQ